MTSRSKALAINLGGTIALLYDGGGRPVTLTGREVLGTAPSDVIDLKPVQSNALTWQHLVELRSTMIEHSTQGTTGFMVLSGTDSAEDLLYFLALTRPAEARVALVVSMADSAAHGDQASHLAAAAGWIEDSGDPALALWCDGRVLEPPVQKVWDSESGDFVFEEKRPSATGLPDWHVPPDATLNPEMPVVPVVSVGVGASDWIRPYLDQAHFDAVVVEAYAAGDVQPELADAIRSVVRSRRPVVLASRSRPGYVKAKFPGVAGASDELLRSGVLSAGALEPNLARLRLALSLALTPPVTPQTAFVTNDSEGQC